jgi:hypothetical protein
MKPDGPRGELVRQRGREIQVRLLESFVGALTTQYRWFRFSPRRIQAWREENELSDRELMRDGRWLV